MAEFPALPLWTDAYLGDTTHLTTIEHGAYFLLLVTAWRTQDCCLPDDDRLLARYARLTPGQWRRIKPTIAAFFRVEDGVWRQSRLTDEAVAVRQKRDAQAANGRASALKRKGRHAAKRPAEREPSDQPKRNQRPTPTATPTTVAKATGADAPPDDPRKAVFDAGVALLCGTGLTERQARPLIAKWCREHGDAWTGEAILSAAGKADPVSWIERRRKPAAHEHDPHSEEAVRERRARLASYAEMPGPPAGLWKELGLEPADA